MDTRRTILPAVPHDTPLFDHTSLREALSIPTSWSDPVFSFLPDKLPPLLAIPSESLAIQARTHRSSRTVAYVKADARKIRATAYDRELASYEVLESLGDRRINAMVYAVLNFHFPFMISAALSDLATRLFRNATLSYISAAYKIPPTLIFGCVGEPDRDQAIAADMFEAHVGAFVRWEMDTGTSSGIDDWLKRLFDPAVWCGVSETAHGLAEAARTLRLKKPKSVPVESLSRWSCDRCDVGFADVLPKPRFAYDTHDNVKGWHAKVFIGDHFIGCGSGKSKALASDQALKNEIAIRHAREDPLTTL
ncbi:hypothetical protein JCM1841_000261 [Sporobolomyces salmonicolor]